MIAAAYKFLDAQNEPCCPSLGHNEADALCLLAYALEREQENS
jgi:hypothetical protein